LLKNLQKTGPSFNFLAHGGLSAPFCGINHEHLHLYVTVDEWACNFKQVTDDFLQAILMSFTAPSG
jgi:hypothetical protein